MPNYFYTAKSASGKTEKGTAFANDERSLAQDLKNKDLLLITADLEDKKNKNFFNITIFEAKVSAADKLMITRNLQIMVSTGLPLVKSFSLLAGQTKNSRLKKALMAIREKIGKGESLADSLRGYPKIFPEIFVNMVAAGEASGTLENALQVLSMQIEKDYRLKSKIQKAMIYPAILLSVMIIVGAIVMAVFVPGLKTLFAGIGAELPIYTKIFIAVGEFVMKYWYFLVLFVGLVIPIILKLLKTPKGRILKDTVLIKLPFFSALVKKSNSASFVRSLSSLIASGVSLVESLEISSRTVSNFYFEKALKEAAEKIKKGEDLSMALSLNKSIFPFGAIETIEVGEETGETSTILKKLADFYEEQVMDAADSVSVLIEPVLIVVLGIAVGIFAFAVMAPLYSSLSAIQ